MKIPALIEIAPLISGSLGKAGSDVQGAGMIGWIVRSLTVCGNGQDYGAAE
jgi:hypothetical protein